MSRLYTYLPKDNTALTEGLLSTALSDRGFEKYRGRTGKYTKEDVLKVLDSWEPEWTRSKAISALTQPIPPDAGKDFQEFARDRKLYSFDTKDLIKAKILAHLRRARKGGGTDPVDDVKKERLNWRRKKKHLLFQGVPHYFVETTGGKIPPEFVREEKKASIKSPEDLDELYSRLKYRVLNKDTNRPFFNTKFETFDKWHLLSPEQIKKHRIGICYDTAAMTDKVLGDLGVEHRNYFAHSDKADSWENDPTHAFNVYKDKDGNWRWLEGSWGKYKGNDWKEKSRKRLVKRIVKALADESGEKQKLHEVAVFPAPGTSMRDWYDAMSKMPVKKADDRSERLTKAREEQLDIS